MNDLEIILDFFRKADLIWWCGFTTDYESEKNQKKFLKILKRIKADRYDKSFKESQKAFKSASSPLEKAIFLEIIGNSAFILGKLNYANESYTEALNNLDEYSTTNKGANLIKAALLSNIGLFNSKTTDLDTALTYFKDAQALYEGYGIKMGQAHQLASIGLALQMKGEITTAIDLIQNALEIDRAIGDNSGEGLDLITLGKSYETENKFNDAHTCYKDALRIFENLGDKHGIGTALYQIGTIYVQRMHPPNAEKFFTQALQINRKIKNKSAEAYALGQIGFMYYQMGYFDTGKIPVSKARKLGWERGDKCINAFLLHLTGFITLEGANGRKNMQRAIDLYHSLGAKIAQGIQTHELAECFVHDGRMKKQFGRLFKSDQSAEELFDGAIQQYKNALTIFEQIGYKQGVANELIHIGRLHLFLKDIDLALKYLNEGLEVAKSIDDIKGKAFALILLGQVSNFKKDPQTALKYLNESLELIKKIEHKQYEGNCLHEICKALLLPRNAEGWEKELGLDPEEFFVKLLETMFASIKVNQEMHNLKSAADGYWALSTLSRQQNDLVRARQYKSQAETLERLYQEEYRSTAYKNF